METNQFSSSANYSLDVSGGDAATMKDFTHANNSKILSDKKNLYVLSKPYYKMFPLNA